MTERENVAFECPDKCEKVDGTLGVVHTTNALIRSEHGKVSRWQGVPCDGCGKTFTVEREPA